MVGSAENPRHLSKVESDGVGDENAMALSDDSGERVARTCWMQDFSRSRLAMLSGRGES
jgi:hypothetical protein